MDIVNPGWAPVYLSNLTEDIPGYIEAPATGLTCAETRRRAPLTPRVSAE